MPHSRVCALEQINTKLRDLRTTLTHSKTQILFSSGASGLVLQLAKPVSRTEVTRSRDKDKNKQGKSVAPLDPLGK
jgi:hypothetical protein